MRSWRYTIAQAPRREPCGSGHGRDGPSLQIVAATAAPRSHDGRLILSRCRTGIAMPTSPPDADALAHSAHLQALIREQIAAAGGAIPFSRFMELALYAPGLGYYSAGATKFGRAGDFVTAPEQGSLFAQCIAEALAPVLRQVGQDAVFVEIGGGSGAFAEHAIKQLMAIDAMPARYAILEPSADLRERQRERLQRKLTPLVFECVE